ncbi:MAG: PD-(D/E)XK nuclease family transposase [Candidatus Ornithomonoglobus sp.]
MEDQSGLTQHEQDLEYIKGFRLIDDDFGKKVFADPECTELILQIILDMPDLKVIEVVAEYDIHNVWGRSVRFDIYAVDGSGKEYNIEIQRADTGAVPARARYNSSLIDANALDKGEKHGDLPETYVIFITENDVLQNGLPIYHIERVITETGDLFGDKAHIIYVNSEIVDDTPLGRLMHDFRCTKAEDMQYSVLAERVRYFKKTEEGVTDMCKAMEEMRAKAEEKGRAEGKAEGRAEGKADLLAALRALGVDNKLLETAAAQV